MTEINNCYQERQYILYKTSIRIHQAINISNSSIIKSKPQNQNNNPNIRLCLRELKTNRYGYKDQFKNVFGYQYIEQ